MALQLQQLREKIQSTRNLQGVVETMRGLAAVNIRRAEAAAEQTEKYARTVHTALHVALKDGPWMGSGAGQSGHGQGQQGDAGEGPDVSGTIVTPADSRISSRVGGRPGDRIRGRQSTGPLVAIVITSDQGLCGQYNERIIDYANDLFQRETTGMLTDRHARPDIRLIVVGLRGYERFADAGERIIAHLDAPSSVEAIPRAVSQTFASVDTDLLTSTFGRVFVIFNRLDRGSSFVENHVQLAPFQPNRWRDLPEGESPWKTPPATPVPPREMLPSLITSQVYVDLFQAFTQAFAAENAARLASMQGASENIEERLAELEGTYRRVRQDVITGELIELMGGVEAVR